MKTLLSKLLTLNSLKVAAFLAFAAVGAVAVTGGSEAAFTGRADNGGNAWATGTINLQTDIGAQALFGVYGAIVPGYTTSRCINVTNDSPSWTSLFLQGDGTGPDLASSLQLSVVEGSGGDTMCNGFQSGNAYYTGSMAAFISQTATTPQALAPTMAPHQSKQYKITVTLPDTADDTLQGKNSTFDFHFFDKTIQN